MTADVINALNCIGRHSHRAYHGADLRARIAQLDAQRLWFLSRGKEHEAHEVQAQIEDLRGDAEGA